MPDVAAALARDGVLTPAALTRALGAARDGDVASSALRLGLAAEGPLVRTLARVHGYPGVDLSRSVVPARNLSVVPAARCRARGVVPVSIGTSEVVLAMADPGDQVAINEMRLLTGRRILPHVAVRAAIDRVVLVIERDREPAWRGGRAPALPDPDAAWVGLERGMEPVAGALEVPSTDEELELLSLADSLAEVHGAAQSSPPVASAATDAAPDAPARVSPASAGPSPGAARPVAVVADDDPELRKLMGLVLGLIGFDMVEAADGHAALALVRERRPPLLVLDAMMPGMHGFDVCAAVKRDAALADTRVVFCSAVYRGTVAEDARVAFGADGYLQKPFRLEEAAATLRAAVSEPPDAEADAAAIEAAAASWRAAVAALKEHRDEEALALCRQAVAQDPLSADAHYWLGHALSRQGLLFEAVAAFERASELRPELAVVHQCL
ncbi:MAG TPA: response regulator, partial [Anaeromyxobacter sp.]|nr:response regulator [Anaeromyxobacter sp.]